MKRLALIIIAFSSLFGAPKTTSAQVAVGISVAVAPPAIPVYEQPPCPVEGYLWTPGYWYWGDSGYFWVPGVWCRPAHIGWLWTPGYWGFEGSHYWWHGGYWGEHVGFYGGICYGFGYGGHGFYGGRWEGGRFRYNTAVCHVGAGFHNTYVDKTVIHNTTVSRSSFNGRGGIEEKPTTEEQSAMKESHAQATSEQQSHQNSASKNKNQYASVNHGSPKTTARSSIGGQKFNAAGHAAAARTQPTHTANANNASHANAGRQQAHQSAPATGGQRNMGHAQQQRSNVQRGGGQRPTQPGRGGQGRAAGGGGRGKR